MEYPFLSSYEDLIIKTKQFWLCQEEPLSNPPQELIMQIIWNEQLFDKPLTLSDNRAIKIASPGTWNTGPGPDFLNAHIQINNDWISGDIELHRFASDWYNHQHQNDPRYQNVILHIIWDVQQTSLKNTPNLPTLSLRYFISSNWQKQLIYKTPETYNYSHKIFSGQCVNSWSNLSDKKAQSFLFTAGLHRLNHKALKLQMISQASSMDQALYEAITESIGYGHNKQAFKALASYCNLSKIISCQNDLQRLSLLLGTLSLLPDPSTTEIPLPLKETLLILWQLWWQSGNPTSPVKCSFLGRPMNSPERRIWGAWEFFRNINWYPHQALLLIAQTAISLKDFYKKFSTLFQIQSTWNKWKNFQISLKSPAQLIGKSRGDDIFINVIIPWLMLHQNEISWFCIEDFISLPKLQNNHLITEASHRFFYPPTRANNLLINGIYQQGLIDIYLNICLACSTDCNQCCLSPKNNFSFD